MTVTPQSLPLALQTFEIRPTPSTLPAGQKVDELMIDWGDLPAGSTASIYLPAVSAADILALASSVYVTRRFSLVDSHTLACGAGGISYLPVPKGSGPNFAGLLAVTLPASIRTGQTYSVTVRQITTAGQGNVVGAVNEASGPDFWRRVLGTFQISLSVKTRPQARVATERLYGVLLWIQEAIAPNDRWYPVFLRYLALLAGTVEGLGGNPGQILPSSTGDLPGLPYRTHPPREEAESEEITGKIEGRSEE